MLEDLGLVLELRLRLSERNVCLVQYLIVRPNTRILRLIEIWTSLVLVMQQSKIWSALSLGELIFLRYLWLKNHRFRNDNRFYRSCD